MSKILELTNAQQQDLAEFRDKWLAIGRSTDPADRPTTERVITEMYGALALSPPRFWWVDGPATGSLFGIGEKGGRGVMRLVCFVFV